MAENKTLRALLLIRDNNFTMASHFGRAMWPDDPGWKRHGKCGHGSGKGIRMRLAAGGFLGRLDKAGLIVKCLPDAWQGKRYYPARPCSLTAAGKQYIKDHEQDV